MNKKRKKNIKKAFIISKILGDNYEFINLKDMPIGYYRSGNINYQGVKWVKTGDLSCGKNHCAAAAATNIALYYANKGYKELKINNNEFETFLEIYKIIKDGPVIKLANKISNYFSLKKHNLKFKSLTGFEDFKKTIEKQMPITVLLSASLSSWHWVIAVGWRQYENGDRYIQIVDNWNGRANRFYKVKSNILYSFMTSYWIDS